MKLANVTRVIFYLFYKDQTGMIRKIFQLIFITVFFASTVKAQVITPEQYIALYKDIAIREMKRMVPTFDTGLAAGKLVEIVG